MPFRNEQRSHLHIYLHVVDDPSVLCLLQQIDRKVNRIMPKLEEATAELVKLKEQVARNRQEVLDKIKVLEDAASNSGNTTPEFDAALSDLKSTVQASDDDVVPAAPTEG